MTIRGLIFFYLLQSLVSEEILCGQICGCDGLAGGSLLPAQNREQHDGCGGRGKAQSFQLVSGRPRFTGWLCACKPRRMSGQRSGLSHSQCSCFAALEISFQMRYSLRQTAQSRMCCWASAMRSGFANARSKSPHSNFMSWLRQHLFESALRFEKPGARSAFRDLQHAGNLGMLQPLHFEH